jgi:hypothetical protein
MNWITLKSDLYSLDDIYYNDETSNVYYGKSENIWFEYKPQISKCVDEAYYVSRSSIRDETKFQIFKLSLKNYDITKYNSYMIKMGSFKHEIISFDDEIEKSIFLFYFDQYIKSDSDSLLSNI